MSASVTTHLRGEPADGRQEWRRARWAAVAVAIALAVVVSSGSASAGTIEMASTGGNWKWHDGFAYGSEKVAAGDFNGDGKDDIVTFQCGQTGDVFVALSTGTHFEGTGVKWHDNFCFRDELPLVGDFNNDRKDDIVTFARGETGDVFVALSTGRSFEGTSVKWHDAFAFGSEIPLVGDFDGNGWDDIATFQAGQRIGRVFVALSSGRSFDGTGDDWFGPFPIGNDKPGVGDFDNDGDDDIALFQCGGRPNGGDVNVALSDRRSFQVPAAGTKWHDAFCFDDETPLVGDFFDDGGDRCGYTASIANRCPFENDPFGPLGTRLYDDGDGKDDIVTFQCGQSGDVFVAHSSGRSFEGTAVKWHDAFCFGGEIPLAGDFDGDGKDDIVVFTRGERPYGGDVYVALSLTWQPDNVTPRHGFTQLSPSQCAGFFRRWSRQGYENQGEFATCVLVMGVEQYCDARDAFVSVRYSQYLRLPTDRFESTARYLACSPRARPADILEDIERIGAGIAQGLVTAFAFAAQFVSPVVAGLGCVNGVLYACVTLAIDIAAYAGFRQVPELREAVAIADQVLTCVNGNIAACAQIGARGAALAAGVTIPGTSIRVPGISIPGVDADAVAHAQACVGGEFGACVRLGLAAASAGGVAAGLGPQEVADVQDCLNGINEACLALGSAAAQAAARATGFPLNGVTQGAANAAQCSRGDSAACIRLGKGLVGSSAVQDAQAVAQCDHGDTNACIKLAKHLVGSGLGQGVANAEKCAQNDTTACTALGRSLVALVRG